MNTLIGCYDKKGLRDIDNNVVIDVENASYFLKSGNYLYVLSEISDGKIYKVDINLGQIIKVANTNGADPCHLGLINNYIVVCNYTSGNIIGFDLNLERIFEKKFQGSSINKIRQKTSHPHCIIPIKNDRYLVTDLGSDKLILLEKDLILKEILLESGTGPRHIVSYNKFYYVNGELDGSVTILNSNLEVINKIYICEKIKDDMGGGAIKIHNAKIYVTIRETNEIYVFDILEDGNLKLFKSVKSMSNHTRDLGFDVNKNLIVGFKNDNLLEIYDGNLNLIETKNKFPRPACINGILV